MTVEDWGVNMGLSACDLAGAQVLDARKVLQRALERAQIVAVANVKAGVPEAAVARALRVNRTTVRRWLGK